MNLIKLQICKEILDASKDMYNKHKNESRMSKSGYQNGYGSSNYCHCRCCNHGGGFSKSPMKFIESVKNSQQLKSLPQTLQGLAALKHGGGHHGGVKKVLPQVLKGIKSRMH